jgi:hypothetical protein
VTLKQFKKLLRYEKAIDLSFKNTADGRKHQLLIPGYAFLSSGINEQQRWKGSLKCLQL